MDVWMVIAGALLVVWPLQYRRSMRRIEQRIAARGGDVQRFRQHMDRRWLTAMIYGVPVVGVAVLVIGLSGS